MQKRSFMQALIALVVALASLAGCDDTAAPPTPSSCDGGCDSGAPGRWQCPEGWVAYERGGCGPAVLLCAAGGGAAAGACEGLDLTRPPPLVLSAGGAVRGFRRLPDGGVGGAWSEEGDPDGPPSASRGVFAPDWAPDAGLSHCPTGWRRLDDGACDPVLRLDCPEGTATPGGRCTPTAERDCPNGDYADLGAEAAGALVWHVLAGADAARADGTELHPFVTVADAIARAGDRDWIRVGRGEYREAIVVRRGSAHVVGVCASRVTLRGDGARAGIEVASPSAVLDLRGVTVSGAAPGLAVAGTLRARAVVVAGNGVVGVLATGRGARVELEGVVVRGTQPRPAGADGRGVEVNGGASLRATGTLVSGNTGVGVFARDAGTRVTLDGCVVRGTLPRRDGASGRGLEVRAEAALQATDVVVADNAEAGVAVVGATAQALGVLVTGNAQAGVVADSPGASVDLTDCVVRDTQARHDGTVGRGLEVSRGALLRASNVLVSGNVEAGVLAIGDGAQVTFDHSVVRDTQPQDGGTRGSGLAAQGGALLRATDALVANNADVGVAVVGGTFQGTGVLVVGNVQAGLSATGAGARIELDDSVVRDTRPRGDGGGGRGLDVYTGAVLRANRVRVVGSADVGVLANDPDTRVELDACAIEGTGGRGLTVQGGAALRATQVLVADSVREGVLAVGTGTQVELRRCVVRDTRLLPDEGIGRGVEVAMAASLQATGVLVSGSAEMGLLAAGEGTQVTLNGCAIRDSRPNAFGFHGRGLEANRGATLLATGLYVAHAAEIGVIVDMGARASLRDVIVEEVVPSQGGLGGGLYVAGADVDGLRLAVHNVAGAGVAAIPLTRVVEGSLTRVRLEDLFVRDIRPGTVRFREDDRTTMPVGRAVAYGLHAGTGCAIEASRAVLAEGEYGFFNAGGTIRVRGGVVAQQRGAAGVVDSATPDGATTLESVLQQDNRMDGVSRRSDLPAGALDAPSR